MLYEQFAVLQKTRMKVNFYLNNAQCQMSIVFAKSMRSTPVMPCVSFRNFHSRYTYTYVDIVECQFKLSIFILRPVAWPIMVELNP